MRLALDGVTATTAQSAAFTDALKRGIAKWAGVPVLAVRLDFVFLRQLESVLASDARRGLQSGRVGVDALLDVPINDTTMTALNMTWTQASSQADIQGGATADPETVAPLVEAKVVASLNAALANGLLFSAGEMVAALTQTDSQQNVLSGTVLSSSSAVVAASAAPTIDASGPSSGLPSAAYAGIAVAFIVVAVAIAAVGYSQLRRKDARRQLTGRSQSATNKALAAAANGPEAPTESHANPVFVEMSTHAAQPDGGNGLRKQGKKASVKFVPTDAPDMYRSASSRYLAGSARANLSTQEVRSFEPVRTNQRFGASTRHIPVLESASEDSDFQIGSPLPRTALSRSQTSDSSVKA